VIVLFHNIPVLFIEFKTRENMSYAPSLEHAPSVGLVHRPKVTLIVYCTKITT